MNKDTQEVENAEVAPKEWKSIKKILRWFVAALIIVYFSCLFAQIAWGFTERESAAAHMYMIWGMKKYNDQINPDQSTEISFRSTELTIPMNVLSGKKSTPRCYKAIEIYDLPGDNWFHSKGLRKGDFIMAFNPQIARIQYFKCYRYTDEEMNNLLWHTFHDILDKGEILRLHVLRVLEWSDKEKLIPKKWKLMPIILKLKKG